MLGCRHVSQGELDCADFAGARYLCLLRSPCVMPDVTVLPCRNWMVFQRRPHGRELVGQPACGPLGDDDLSTRQGPQRSRIYLVPFNPSESAPGIGRLVLDYYEEGNLDGFLSLVVHG